jgi:hypothetical protein
MKKNVTLLILCWLLATGVWAQTSVTIGTSTFSSSSAAGPTYISSATAPTKYSRQISIYKASEIIAGGVFGGSVKKIRWYKTDVNGYTANNGEFKIYVKPTAAVEFTTTTVDWTTEVAGATLVYSSNTQNLNTAVGWQEFALSTPIHWDGTSNLEVFVDWYRPSDATGGVAWQYSTAAFGNAITAGTTAPVAVGRNSSRPNIQFEFAAPNPNDIGLLAITAPTSPIQPGISMPIEVTLRNFGSNPITTATISWKLNNGAFTDYSWTGNLPAGQAVQAVIGSYTFTPGTYTVTAKTSQPNGATDSYPLNDERITTVISCASLSGNYTINKAGTTSGTNFKTIGEAAQLLGRCGVSGPTTFSVIAGSGPYNELVTLTNIPGASSTNTVTFEGNGNTVSSLTAVGEAIIKFDGADYVKFNNFKLKLDGTASAGFAVYMLNSANSNTISNSTLFVPKDALNSTMAGLYIKNSGNNVIENDTILGAFYSVLIEDAANGTATVNNKIRDNFIPDTYMYGLFLNNATGTIIERNNISRPTRANGSTFYGIYLSGTCTNTIISKNRIHNTHDVASVLSGQAYAIYLSSVNTLAGSENIIKNNLIYNINNSLGIIYAIYHNGGSGAFYYNNTIVLDNPNHANAARGFFLSGPVANVKFNNNIITLAGTSSTPKHLIYVSATTSIFESNNNDLFIHPGAVGCFTGFFASDIATFAGWKAANGGIYDQNSVAVNPGFENRAANNLKPTSFFLNNIGKPLAAVTDDIADVNRTATPDPGAYEFTPPANDAAVTAITSLSSGCGKTSQETVTVTVTNMGINQQSNIPVQFSTDGGVTWSAAETVPGPLSAGQGVSFTFAAKANLSAIGAINVQARTQLTGDAIPSNDAFTKVVDALPTITTYPYNQDFETNDGGWKASGTNSSWALGTPAKSFIIGAASGTKAWVTSLTGFYNSDEQSAVVSPCLSFSTLQKPLMEMKVCWNAQASFDGAVLQSSIDNGQTWVNVGSFGEDGWYNDASINAGPGGQSSGTTNTAEGWTGNTATAPATSGGWVTVKHALPGLQQQPNVRLRIAFGADAFTNYDGFAFDDVKIYDSPQNDVGVIAISQMASGCGLGATENVTITVRNFGLAPQTNVPVTYALDGANFISNETIPGTISPNATATYTFNTKANLSVAGVYNLTACTKLTGDGDATNDCRSLQIRSVPTITTYPYFQDFETNDGGWVASGTNSSWALGTPAKAVIKGAASGTKAFVTKLTGTYNNTETSIVLGPCFNFSSLTNPQIDMKVWWHSEFSVDGAVLQASIDNGITWNNVGFNADPNNWFNDGSINAAPGGQAVATAEGWTGNQGTTSSNGWVRARHALTGLGGQSNVKLRIAFASNSYTAYDGFAFDDILIYDRPTTDALVTNLSSFGSGCGLGQETVNIIVENSGTTAITNLVVKFQVTPQFGAPLAPVTDTIPGTIAPGASQAFTFNPGKANLSIGGVNTITASTMLTGDQVPQNDATSTKQETIPTITTYPYIQDFENGDGGWKASGTNSTWALGTPAKNTIKGAASGANAWVTHLTGQYSANENSQVLGPCFNFSSLVDPAIELKIWWNCEADFDGAVLQSSIDNGTTWQTVGALGEPNNWYNDGSLDGRVGGQNLGWAGRANITSNGSNGWVLAKNYLKGLGGQSNVKLRIAFGSDAPVVEDGFAFDDIVIREASNNVELTAFAPFTRICGFSATETVSVTVKNLSNAVLLKFPVKLYLNNNLVATDTVRNLVGNTTSNIAFNNVNLSAAGQHTLRAEAVLAADPDQVNNTITTTVTNSLFASLPQGFNFESTGQGLSALRTVTAAKSAITESTGASSTLGLGSTKGIVMDATTGSAWTLPILTVDPWANNLDNMSGVYMCLPAQPATDSLWLLFDLKQTFKTAAANTNFRVTINGSMVGATMRPPTDGTPDVWKTVKVNLRSFKNAPIQVGLESSTSEAYDNGAGTANLIDNIIIRSRVITGSKDDILQGKLNVFPNPSTGIFNVNLPENKAYELEVVDMTGRTIKHQSVKGGNSTLNLQGTSQGIYLLKVKTENATAIRKLIIE